MVDRGGSSSGAIPAQGRCYREACSRPDGAIYQGTVGAADGRGTGLGAKAEGEAGRVTGLGAGAEAGRGEGGKVSQFLLRMDCSISSSFFVSPFNPSFLTPALS